MVSSESKKGLVAMSALIGFWAPGFQATEAEENTTMTRAAFKPVVEVEEEVYRYGKADNGSAPMWCYGSTCLVRIGDDVFVSGLDLLKGVKPLNNVRWVLFKRTETGWELQQKDEKGRTREPCPLVGFPDGRLFISVNPTLTGLEARNGPSQPQILQFSAADAKAPFKTILPSWRGSPMFSEHTYRAFAGDGHSGQLILFNNARDPGARDVDSAWAFLDSNGEFAARGTLLFPKREYTAMSPYKSKTAKITYANVVVKNRAAHYCGLGSYNKWERVPAPHETPERVGRQWGLRYRRLMYAWTPDITKHKFSEWIEIDSNCLKTGGYIMNGDMWVAPDGMVHIVWIELSINKRLRDKFFPDMDREYSLKYARVQNGKVVFKRTLVQRTEKEDPVVVNGALKIRTHPDGRGWPRFQVTPDNRVFLVYFVRGYNSAKRHVSENRMMELFPGGTTSEPVALPLKHPLYEAFNSSLRGGCSPSNTLDLLGYRYGDLTSMGYARIELKLSASGKPGFHQVHGAKDIVERISDEQVARLRRIAAKHFGRRTRLTFSMRAGGKNRIVRVKDVSAEGIAVVYRGGKTAMEWDLVPQEVLVKIVYGLRRRLSGAELKALAAALNSVGRAADAKRVSGAAKRKSPAP